MTIVLFIVILIGAKNRIDEVLFYLQIDLTLVEV